jgi:hypothetical protein
VFSNESLVVVGADKPIPTFASVAQRMAPPSQPSASTSAPSVPAPAPPDTIHINPRTTASRAEADAPVTDHKLLNRMFAEMPACLGPPLLTQDTAACTVVSPPPVPRLSPSTSAGLGSGLRDTGRRCGLRVIAGNDFVVYPGRRPQGVRPTRRHRTTVFASIEVSRADSLAPMRTSRLAL